MPNFDITPLLRASVGFDRMANLLDSLPRMDEATPSYPPYNIEKTGENAYRITMAVAGFAEDELEVLVKEGTLSISGRKGDSAEKGGKFLHRGIATRSFERRFDLAEYIQVTGARLENGLLAIELVRELPEAMKPRSIKISHGAKSKAKVIESTAA